MPSVSQFYGIDIYMYYNDHAPPHFHALYADDEAVVSISSGQLIAGALPRRARAIVEEWQSLHRDELTANWELARRGLPLQPIPPLP